MESEKLYTGMPIVGSTSGDIFVLSTLLRVAGKYRGESQVSSTRFDGFSQPSAPTLSPRRNENAEVPTPTAPTRSPTFHPRFLQLDRSPLPARRIRSRPHSLGEVALLRAGGGLQSTESQLLLRRASGGVEADSVLIGDRDRKSTRLNSSHGYISYAVFCLKKKKTSRI